MLVRIPQHIYLLKLTTNLTTVMDKWPYLFSCIAAVLYGCSPHPISHHSYQSMICTRSTRSTRAPRVVNVTTGSAALCVLIISTSPCRLTHCPTASSTTPASWAARAALCASTSMRPRRSPAASRRRAAASSLESSPPPPRWHGPTPRRRAW